MLYGIIYDMQKKLTSIEQAQKDLQKIVGLPVARTWKGYGTAIFFELGNLYKSRLIGTNNEVQVSIKGDWSLCIETTWQLIKDGKVLFDAAPFNVFGADTKPIKKILEQLVDTSIASLQFIQSTGMLIVVFSSGITLQ